MDQQGITSDKGPEGTRFARNVLGVFTTELLIAALSFATGVLTARLLGPYAQGVFFLVVNLPLSLTFFTDLGLVQANIYLISQRKEIASALAANSVFFSAFIGLGTLGAVYVGQDYLRHVFNDLNLIYLFLTFFTVPFLLLDRCFLSILQGLGRFDLYNYLRLLTPVSLLAGLIGVVMVCDLGLSGAVWTFVIVSTALTFVGAAIVNSIVPLHLEADYSLAREAFAFGFKAYLQLLLIHLLYRSSLYLLAGFLQPEDVAYYGVAVSLAGMIWYIPDSVGTVLFPALSSTQREVAHRFTTVVCRQTLLITTLLATVLFAVSGVLIPFVYGRTYARAIEPLLVLVPGVVLITSYKVVVRNFTSRNRLSMPIITAAAGLALNIGLSLILIPRYGIVGAAISSTVAYSVSAVALLGAFLRDSGASLCETVLVQRGDLAMYVNVLHRLWLSLRAWRRGSLPSP